MARSAAKGLAFSTTVILALTGTLVANQAQACSYAGPVDFKGYAVLFDVETGARRQVSFEQVGIDSLCRTANRVDVAGSVALVTDGRGVRLFDLERDRGFLALGVDDPVGPTLDGPFVYYGSYPADALYRMDFTTRVQEVVLQPADFGTFGIRQIDVAHGVVAWTTYDGNPLLNVYDSQAQRFLLRNGVVPSWPRDTTGELPYLLDVTGSVVRFLRAGRDVVAYDVSTNSTSLVGQLPGPLDFPRNLAASGNRFVYGGNRTLVLYDSDLNATMDLHEDARATGLAMAGSFIAYDYHEVYSGLPPLALAAVMLGIVVAASTVVALYLVRGKKH